MYSAAADAPSIPISYGSISFWNGKKANAVTAEHTHRWLIFLRHAEDLDLTFAIAKVVFVLHASFQDHVRGELRSGICERHASVTSFCCTWFRVYRPTVLCC
jgi:hypothetical protein